MKKIKLFHDSIERNHGFTLIEIMIAMLILTIALLALVSVTVMVIKGNSLNKMMTTATTLAKDQMETLKNTSKTSNASFDSVVSSSWSAVAGFPGYERQWTVNTTTGNSSCTGSGAPYACCTGSNAGTCPDSKRIVMEVRWTWQNSPHTATLNTIITKGY
jgi:prepilin-type N-terminal cleavage/methylation domain-containing protein